MKTSALAALVVFTLTSTPVGAAPRGRLTVWARGSTHLVAGGPGALRVGTQRSFSPTEVGPWPGATVELALQGKGRRAVLGSAVADEAGEANVRFVAPDWPDGEYTLELSATADGARGPSARSTRAVTLSPSARLLLQSDKPLYQPGQTVHLRVAAMRPSDAKPLANAPVRLEVFDPRDNRVFLEERRTSGFGVASADFELGSEVSLGVWRARVSSDAPGAAPHELELKVERYALPTFAVALEPDLGWYRPGATVKLAVEARTFIGKPVSRGRARVQLTSATDVRAVYQEARTTLDADGRGRVELTLPADTVGTVAVRADVTDTAEHVERATRQLRVATEGLQVELVTADRSLLAGIGNELWAVAARPDGTPLEGAAVELSVGDGPAEARGRTNGLGIADVGFRPVAAGACLRVRVAATLGGETASDERCVPVLSPPLSPCGAAQCAGRPILLRTDRALYPAGAPVVVDVYAPGATAVVLLDVVKDGRPVDAVRVEVVDGRGTVTLPPDERRFGALQLRAGWAAVGGRSPERRRRGTGERLVYVERPGALAVTATATRPGDPTPPATFRPGETARISLSVVDAASGAPARASVGVVMVDRALLALRPVRPAMAKAWFHLAQVAALDLRTPRVRPGGLGLEELVERGGADAPSEQAARVLLAGASPGWRDDFEADGFAALVAEAEARTARVQEALMAYQVGHLLGERVPGTRATWRWRRGLLAQMVADGALRRSDRWDPWGVPVPLEVVTEQLGDFATWADADVGERLTAAYAALVAALKAGSLTVSLDAKPVVTLTQEDVDRLVADKHLAAGLATDPWGNRWRVTDGKKLRWIAGIRSREVVVSDGPDGLPGTADDRFPADASAYGSLSVVAAIGSASGYGGLGLRGVGVGGGGVGVGMGVLGGKRAIGVVSLAGAPTAAGPGGRTPAKVRSEFPETLLWRPEVLTDERGEAAFDVTLADSITTWVLAAEAVDAEGRLGHTTLDVRVMQDFFADLDLPPVMTQHDELAVPVAVYNYLKVPQRVSLRFEQGAAFELLAEREQGIDLGPGEVGVRYFRVRALTPGRHALTVHASAPAAEDAVRREVEVFPDGLERVASWQSTLGTDGARHPLVVPATAIAGTPRATLKLYPGMGAQVVDGLENMLQMPAGCFEQSSSTTYPNALILDYLRKTKKATPELEARARRYLAAGYQKLVSFEVRGGGFSWFGDAPANKVLTAYGLEEFVDMAKVYPVDPRLLERTRRWLLDRQADDGHWAAEPSPINEGATDHYERDTVRTTAYIALALHKAGAPREAVLRATRYVVRHLSPTADAYTVALANELVARTGVPSLSERLWQLHRRSGPTVFFAEAPGGTLTHGAGRSGDVETTARAALSLLAAGAPGDRVSGAVDYLVASKDARGNWYSTQATIRSLQALLEYEAARGQDRNGVVTVSLDGRAVTTFPVVGAHQLAQTVELPGDALTGAHEVTLAYRGTGTVSYQLVSRYFEPRPAATEPAPAPAFFTVGTQLSRDGVQVGDTLQATVVVTARSAVAMPVVTAGLPPGFHVDEAALERLVLDRRVDKYERRAREVVFYLTSLQPHLPLELPLTLVARLPGQVQVPAPSVYEYYRPENVAEGAPVRLRSTL